MRESFWLKMEVPLQETHDLAFDLFDRYGRLDREFYEHDFRKGTGVWGNELNRGDLLLFETLKVHADYRRCDIGTNLVKAILAKTRKKVSESVGFFAVARPRFLYTELPREGAAQVKKEICEISLGFWHSLGFRRVGTSSWFARTDSPDHPSRHLEIDQDWKQPDEVGNSSSSDRFKQIFERLADPAVEETKCIEELTNTLPEDSEDEQWLSCNQDGNTILHVAAMACKPELIKFVFSRAARLAAVRNKEGYTALEALRNQLEHQRTRKPRGTRTEVTSDAFKGFNMPNIACIAALENTTAFDLEILTPGDIEVAASVTDEEIQYAPQFDIAGIRNTLRYKYGCTCGQCVGGFLSSRMKFALLCVAELHHDLMHDAMHGSGPCWVECHDDLLTHLPGYVRGNLKTNKSMREGFANMCDHFAECLRRGIIPTERGVLDVLARYQNEWPPVTKNFLQRGGTVAAVANMIFEKAMEGDEWAGDGEDREVFGEEIDELAVCRNDHEFGFVGGMCGYKRVRPASS